MALPPTKIYEYIKEKHEDTFEALGSAGLLEAGVSKEEFVKVLEAKEKKYFAERPDMPGPNLTDNIAEALHPFAVFHLILFSRPEKIMTHQFH